MSDLSQLEPAMPSLEPGEHLYDSHNRRITDLRVSITDRCNYKCVYCRTGTIGPQFAELPTEDYLRLIRNFVALGIEKVRLTGGEPLLRNDLLAMVRELASWRTPSGNKLDLAITTNGHLLEQLAQPLKDSGLTRITVSMDAVGTESGVSSSGQLIFERITRVPGSYQAVVSGIRAAKQAGFHRLKVNCVLLRGFNDDQIEAFAAFARSQNIIVRFIEFMPLEEDRLWSPNMVVPLSEIVERISKVYPLQPLPPNSPSETARRYGFVDDPNSGHPDGQSLGEIGIIAPVTQPFCGACSRIRLTSDGKIRTCLFSNLEHDLYTYMKRDCSDRNLQQYILRIVQQKEARHHIGEAGFLKPSRSMVHIGG
jgi:cyclic pyranopterin phosphate synthase